MPDGAAFSAAADCQVIYASMNLVRRVKRVLEAQGDYFAIMRTPHALSSDGCAFSIRCARGCLSRVQAVSANLGIPIKGIYHERHEPDGLCHLRLDEEAGGDLS